MGTKLAVYQLGREKEIAKVIEWRMFGEAAGSSGWLARPGQGSSGFPMVPTTGGPHMSLLLCGRGCVCGNPDPSSPVPGAAAPAAATCLPTALGFPTETPWTIPLGSQSHEMSSYWV